VHFSNARIPSKIQVLFQGFSIALLADAHGGEN
jgi:hypothetical protein